jgi:hypothetical protein
MVGFRFDGVKVTKVHREPELAALVSPEPKTQEKGHDLAHA